MAKFVLKDAVITVGGADLSDHCSSVAVEITTDEVDVTSYSDSEFRETIDGFKDATISATVFQDFGAGEVDSILWPLSTGGTAFEVTVKPHAEATSATNPIYKLPSCRMYNYSPLGGGIGDAAQSDISFKNAGTAGLTRGTA